MSYAHSAALVPSKTRILSVLLFVYKRPTPWGMSAASEIYSLCSGARRVKHRHQARRPIVPIRMAATTRLRLAMPLRWMALQLGQRRIRPLN